MPVWRYPRTGRQARTYSPSSSSTIRSTPWVDGCCGPMLMIMVSSRIVLSPVAPSRVTAIVPTSQASLVGRRDERAVVLGPDAGERVVLPQREGLPSVGQLDPPEVRMPVEDDAEEVEDLALVPVRRGEECGDAGHTGVVSREADLDPQPVAVRRRVQVIGDPEPGLAAQPVGGGHVRQEVERQRLVAAEPSQGVDQLARGDHQRDLTPGLEHVGEARPEMLGELAGREPAR